MKVTLITIGFALSSFFANSQLETYPASPEFAITQDFLGWEYVVFNVQYTGYPDAFSTFNGDNCNVGLSKGIHMNTGDTRPNGDGNHPGAHGPNNSAGAGFDNNQPGSPLISAIVPNADNYNAATVSFDVSTILDSISFRYVFGSEEYLEYVNSGFNDVFAIYISGPGINGRENISRLPNGDIVSIDNVNAVSNSSYFIDNGDGSSAPQNSSDQYIQYDGFTTPIVAKANVIPGEVYTITIVIADVGDGILDSGLFIESCETCNFNVGIDEQEMTNVVLYPNPSNGEVNLRFPPITEQRTVYVHDLAGKLVQEKSVNQGTTDVKIDGLVPGSYIVTIGDDNRNYWTGKAIVQPK